MSYGEDTLGVLLKELFPLYRIKDQFNIGQNLRLDYFIVENNTGWEYDGIQHYKFNSLYHENIDDLKNQYNRDRKKEDICSSLGINLIRISYKEDLSIDLLKQYLLEIGAGPGSSKLDKLLNSDIKHNNFYEKALENQRQMRRKKYREYKQYLKNLKAGDKNETY